MESETLGMRQRQGAHGVLNACHPFFMLGTSRGSVVYGFLSYLALLGSSPRCSRSLSTETLWGSHRSFTFTTLCFQCGVPPSLLLAQQRL
ncbi:hypothetical protein Y1Q_0012897 [Alligator mississippiensis]|uniref:Uncharacterized protein n=1 Tax=Alligator mississippiensis TaxID=8496 RepID=A0A151P4H0_ALLMI|nr:hypothetical protein Y1Q_0012897 [Alligator mississippiensis]